MTFLIVSDLDFTLLPEHSRGNFELTSSDLKMPQSIVHFKELVNFLNEVEKNAWPVRFSIATGGFNIMRAYRILEHLSIPKEKWLAMALFIASENDTATFLSLLKNFNQKALSCNLSDQKKKFDAKQIDFWGSSLPPSDYFTDLNLLLPKFHKKILKQMLKKKSINFVKEARGKSLHILNLIVIHNHQNPEEEIEELLLIDDDERMLQALLDFPLLVNEFENYCKEFYPDCIADYASLKKIKFNSHRAQKELKDSFFTTLRKFSQNYIKNKSLNNFSIIDRFKI